ncbi:hypothetical protein MTO96_044821 [Rhipicephalus appendiculatus]
MLARVALRCSSRFPCPAHRFHFLPPPPQGAILACDGDLTVEARLQQAECCVSPMSRSHALGAFDVATTLPAIRNDEDDDKGGA